MINTFKCKTCSADIDGTNCAYMLSYLSKVKANKASHSWCKCGWIIRAKETKDYYFSGYIDDDKNSNVNAYIYCAIIVDSKERGHVYYGTYDTCVTGNNYTAKQMGATIFLRYSSYAS